MRAELVTRFKDVTPEGAVIELVAWRVPEPVPPATHGHIAGQARLHAFTTVARSVEDFIAAVDAARSAT